MQTFQSSQFRCAAILVLSCLCSVSVAAANLTIGFKAEITTADPHVPNANNRNIWAHVYEPLVAQDENLRSRPALALSWKVVNPTTWEFKLRPNVLFHNGAPFTAEDVKYTIERALAMTGPRTLRVYLRDVASVAVIDPMTVQIKTKTVTPILPDNISVVPMIPKSLGANLAEDSFASGKSAIGTGPFKFVEWANNQRVVLARNDAYWGGKEPWEKVVFQFIPKEPARAAALLSGTVDVIDAATNQMGDMFKNSGKIDTVSQASYMLNYLMLNRVHEQSQYIKSIDGKPLPKNPFNDLKVRQALMMAVNREGIIKQIMKGDAEATGQMVQPDFFGYNPNLKTPVFDMAKAKTLLAEAGYPNGFSLTLHCPHDHYMNDVKVCEAVSQSFTQIGVKTEMKAMPFAVLRPRSINGGPNGTPEFSMVYLGIGATTGDALGPLAAVAHTQDKASAFGANNFSGYSNKEVDALIEKASVTMDEGARSELLKSAVHKLVDDVGLIPVLIPKASWAFKKGLVLKPRSDGFTYAMNIRPAK